MKIRKLSDITCTQDLEVGVRYELTPAIRLFVRDYAGFYPDLYVTCFDTGQDPQVVSNTRPERLEDGSWVLPYEAWEWKERLAPGFSDNMRKLHDRSFRIELADLIEAIKVERYVRYEREQLAKEKALARKKQPTERQPKTKAAPKQTKKPMWELFEV